MASDAIATIVVKNILKAADIDPRHIIGWGSLPWPFTQAISGSVTYLDLSTCITGQWAKHIDPVSQQTQNICRTFVQRRPNVFDVGPTLCKCYTSVLFLLGLFQTSPRESKWWWTRPIQCDVLIWLSALENKRRDEIAWMNNENETNRMHCYHIIRSLIMGNISAVMLVIPPADTRH